jgi:hypothetical protein
MNRSENLPSQKYRTSERILWFALTVLFIGLRIFTEGRDYYVGFGDEAGFFRLALNLPSYKLFCHNLYLIHPPLYFCVLRLFLFIQDPHVGGLLFSFACAAVLWWILFAFLRLLRVSGLAACACLGLIAGSNLSMAQHANVCREPFLLMITWGTLYFYTKGFQDDLRFFKYAAILGVIMSWTTDFVLLIFPILLLGAFFWKKPELRRSALLTTAITAVAYLGWVGVRFFEYHTHPYVAAGIDGIVEPTRNLPWLALLNPNFLPMTRLHVQAFLPPPAFHPEAIRILFANPFWDHRTILVLLACGLIVLANVRAAQRNGLTNPTLYFTIATVILLLPLFMGQWPRYGILGSVGIGILLSLGVQEALSTARNTAILRALPHFLSALCVILTAIWILAHPVFTLSTKMQIEGENVAAEFKRLPDDSVMAPIGLTGELAYLTGKSLVAMPISAADLDSVIRLCHVRYIVVPHTSMSDLTPSQRYAMAEDTLHAIETSAGRYTKIAETSQPLRLSLNWHQRAAWNPAVTPREPVDILLPQAYSIYTVSPETH